MGDRGKCIQRFSFSAWATMTSPFPEGVCNLFAERLQQVFHGRAPARLNEDFSLHARQEMKIAKPLYLALGQGNAGEIVGLRRGCRARARRISRRVGGNMDQAAVQFRHRALVAGVDSNDGRRTLGHLVDLIWHHLGFDDQLVPLRNDGHDRLAVADDAADGVNAHGVHDPRTRCTDINPIKLVFGRDHLVGQFGDLAVNLTQVFQNLGTKILVDLDDLQFGFADFGASPGDLGNRLASLAFEARLVALQLVEAGDRNEVFAVKLSYALQLLGDEVDLFFLRRLLSAHSTNFFIALRNAFTKLRALTGARLSS